SDTCPSLHNVVGYYLDFVEIMVSPIAFNSEDRLIFTLKKAYNPHVENANVELSTGQEANTSFQFAIGTPQNMGATIGHSVKNNTNTKSMTNEWCMNSTHCP